jgi:signal transduction histidine kinase
VRTEPRPSQEDLRPPQAKRLRPGQWVALDYLAAGLFALLAFALLRRAIAHPSGFVPWPARVWLGLPLAVAMSVPVALRRSQPTIALAVLAPAAALAAAAGRIIAGPLFFLPVAYVLYLVATTRRRRAAVIALVAVLALMTADALVVHLQGLGAGNTFSVALVMIIIWTIASAVAQSRAHAARLRQQAASSAVADERLRIARELHDVVAHSMTVVAVQAGFGQYVFDTQPAQARAALGAIQASSREALAEMQRMLGVLRQAGPDPAGPGPPPGPARASGAGGGLPAAAIAPQAPHGPPLLPQPGLDDLDRLVARTANAGVRVDLQWTGRRRVIPAGIDLSAYRIVQEALTNVVKHARATSCRVRIGYGDSDLSIEITDDGPAAGVTGGLLGTGGAANGSAGPVTDGHDGNGGIGGTGGTGHGLIGMRERVHLYRGQFSAVPLPGQGFRVTARLPLEEAAR